jgi:PIN domain nuclease of toxin-antitoxin system
MPPSVLVGSSFLPGPALRDPADRIIAATARTFDLRLMTRDRPLLEFASAGHVQAIAC